jgi:ABC-type branched-subunit amino acid transport system ATPase component
MSAPALSTRGLSKAFGSLPVARDIAINLPVGARYALIGPNGAGKTTLINLMTGMLTPNAGQILLGGEDITALGPQERVRRGLARTFQINTLFVGLNALEAVTLAVTERRGRALRRALEHMATLGVTSVQDMGPDYDDIGLLKGMVEPGVERSAALAWLSDGLEALGRRAARHGVPLIL